MPPKLILYSYYRSSCSYRVRIVLAKKNVPFEYKSVNLIKDGGEHRLEEYQKVNPFNFVPSLAIVEGEKINTIFESMAIIDYLEQNYSTPSIYPKDCIDRAKSIAIAESIVSGIQPLQNLSVLKMIEKLGGDKNHWAKDIMEEKFESLEKILQTTSQEYCVKNEVSIADICLVPQVYNALRFGVDLNKYPIIKRITERLEKLSFFRAAHPDYQPDTPRA